MRDQTDSGVLGAQLNRFGFSVGRSGPKEVLNVFMGGPKVSVNESRLLAESLYSALFEQVAASNLGSSEQQAEAEAAQQLTGRAPTNQRDKELTKFGRLMTNAEGGEEEVIESLSRKIREGGLVAFRHDFADQTDQLDFMEKIRALRPNRRWWQRYAI